VIAAHWGRKKKFGDSVNGGSQPFYAEKPDAVIISKRFSELASRRVRVAEAAGPDWH
jgi:hypothetical protein